MKTAPKVALLVLATAGVMATMAHLFWPGGLPALIERLTPEAAGRATQTPAPAPGDAPSAARQSGADKLRDAEAAYDAGDFDRAVQLFLEARVDLGREGLERAARGLDKAVLAWALTSGPRVDAIDAAAIDEEMARLQAQAESEPSEKAWYDAAMFAASNGLHRKLKHVSQQAIDCALPRGPVEQRLKRSLELAGPRTSTLKSAMVRAGFLEPEDPLAVAAGTPSGPAPAAQPAPRTASKRVIYPPNGSFKPETKAKLAKAVELEKLGTDEYEQSGPDNAKRKEHRKAAMDFLKQARDIYEAAQDEDPGSLDVDRRLHAVLEMFGQLRKDASVGD